MVYFDPHLENISVFFPSFFQILGLLRTSKQSTSFIIFYSLYLQWSVLTSKTLAGSFLFFSFPSCVSLE